MTYGGNDYGDPSLRGTGNHGVGGYRQLAVRELNPDTRAMADQENMDKMIDQQLDEGHPSDQFYRNKPGFPNMNALVANQGEFSISDNILMQAKVDEAEDYYDSQSERYGEHIQNLLGSPPVQDDRSTPLCNEWLGAPTVIQPKSMNKKPTHPAEEPEVDELTSLFGGYLVDPTNHETPPVNTNVPQNQTTAALVSPRTYVPPDKDTGEHDDILIKDPLYAMTQRTNLSNRGSMAESLMVEASAKDIRRLLRKYDCVELRQNGSHLQVRCGGCTSTIPIHGSSDIKLGTLKGIEKSLGICLGPNWTKVDPGRGQSSTPRSPAEAPRSHSEPFGRHRGR